jgi:uncharacterized protein YjbI with pentapeptide repeats
MPQSLIVISRRSLVAGLLLFAALVATAAIARAEAASSAQEPRIVAVEGFAFEANRGEGLRVAALVLSRYPDVATRDYPKPLREHLRFRAHARLDVFDGEARIARGREAGSLPVAAKRHSLRFVHLLLFSRTESKAILAADDPEATPARGLESAGAEESVETSALSALKVIAEGEVLERSSVEEEALTGLADQRPPRVVRGCVIQPGTQCPHADLAEEDLSDANLSGANLSGAEFYGDDLTGANLSRANLSGAKLEEAWLSRANLSGANLSDARVEFADLSGANLSHANLSGARFTDSNLFHANLFGANTDHMRIGGTKYCHTTSPDGDLVNQDCPSLPPHPACAIGPSKHDSMVVRLEHTCPLAHSKVVVRYDGHDVRGCAGPVPYSCATSDSDGNGTRETVTFTGTTEAHVKLAIHLVKMVPQPQAGDSLRVTTFFTDGTWVEQSATLRP